MRTYGLPYKGSKNKIARWVVDLLPRAQNFYDIFAGGCAVTHAAMESDKWTFFYANDINPLIPQFFKDCAQGNIKGENRVITREEFEKLKNTDPYVRLCWSFGNNGRNYLWSRDIEDIKLLACRMLMASTWQERRRHYLNFISNLQSLQSLERLERLQSLQSLERLQSLQSLERLQSLQSLERLEVSGSDYSSLTFRPDSTIYADPPYSTTKVEYGKGFNHQKFYEWLRSVPFPVFISEYSMPQDFISIAHKERRSTLSATDNQTIVAEHLFLHQRWIGWYQSKMNVKL